MSLTLQQKERYDRNIKLEGFGEESQEKLMKSKVLIVGAGGIGSPVAYYLGAVGVGEIGIVESDVVDLSNLQRQILHTTQDIDKSKAQSAKAKLNLLNPEIQVKIFEERLNANNALEIIADYDLVIEATDVFVSKFLINDACVLAGKTLVRGSALHYCAQVMSIKPKESACYACLFDSPPKGEVPTGASVGILGAVAGLSGVIEANEAIKILTGIGEPLFNAFLTCDIREMDFRKVSIRRNPQCRVCGEKGITTLQDY